MKRKFVLAATLCVALAPACSLAQAYNSDGPLWIQIAQSENSGMTVQARKDSFEISRNQGGEPIAAITVQLTYRDTSRIDYLKYYVTKQDCLAGEGKLVAVNTTGVYQFDNDFVSGGGSVASAISDLICSLYKTALAKQASKSI